MSMIDSSKSSIGVGNYKGVMLCNRPFGGTAGNFDILVDNILFALTRYFLICRWSLCIALAISRQVGTSETNAFNCGVVPDALGTNVPISSREKVHPSLCSKAWWCFFPFELPLPVSSDFNNILQNKIERPKKDSVISKHRKWLADLQKQKDFLESQHISQMAERKEVQIKVQFLENFTIVMIISAMSITTSFNSTPFFLTSFGAKTLSENASTRITLPPQLHQRSSILSSLPLSFYSCSSVIMNRNKEEWRTLLTMKIIALNHLKVPAYSIRITTISPN